MTSFSSRLHERIQRVDSRVCLGIDPRPDAHPLTHPSRFKDDPAQVAKAVVYYFQAIIQATESLVACYKLQSAFFEALGIPGLISMAQLSGGHQVERYSRNLRRQTRRRRFDGGGVRENLLG